MLRQSLWMLALVALLSLAWPAQAAPSSLPASNWYAVTWVKTTDTLHWVNAAGEQASLPRPKLPNEAGNLSQTTLHISPNGRILVETAPLLNGNLGVGFYSFTTGQFIQTHEAQPNETLSLLPSADFTIASLHFAMVLRDNVTGEWRIIVFETTTGNAIAQLTRNSAGIPDNFITDTSFWPVIADFDIDEGLGELVVYLQQVTDPLQMMTAFPSFKWYPTPAPQQAANPIVPAALPFSYQAGYDVLETTGEVVFTGFNEQQGAPTSPAIGNFIGTYAGQLPTTVFNAGSYSVNTAQWMHNGDWISYRVQGGAMQPHYEVALRDGSNAVPVGPNIGAVHGTPDGFVAVDALSWKLYHATDLNFEGFSAFFGNTLFQTDNQPFSVVYVTPEGATFTLEDIAQPPVVSGPGGIQAPPFSCAGAPPTRLAVGDGARVAFTDGTDLNIRTAAGGDYLMQIPEGTLVTIQGGPECVNNYVWWNLSLGNGTGGWAAEGDASGYFLEPIDLTIQIAPAVTPTNPPRAINPTPTNPPRAGIPTATPPVILAPACNQSPQTQLQVGMLAHTAQTDGTLAMRVNLSDQFPTYQLPSGLNVTILEGYQCLNGQTMWKVSTTLNGQSISGWVAEGFGQTYFLLPGAAS
ncbi:MAG: hypothetical protein H6673_06825 [Anaerolineales bacterium]|nr:hypothetical protein [Anaerolineales bacterium]